MYSNSRRSNHLTKPVWEGHRQTYSTTIFAEKTNSLRRGDFGNVATSVTATWPSKSVKMTTEVRRYFWRKWHTFFETREDRSSMGAAPPLSRQTGELNKSEERADSKWRIANWTEETFNVYFPQFVICIQFEFEIIMNNLFWPCRSYARNYDDERFQYQGVYHGAIT